MSEEEAIARESALLWRDMVAKALEDKWMPVALIGARRAGQQVEAGIATSKKLPNPVMLEILRQIVAELEREEHGNGQRVS